MTAQHTPGPWSVKPEEVDRAYIRVRGTHLGGRFKIANVLTPNYEGSHPREADETRANAHLIAAAPDLLAALQVMLRDYAAVHDIGDVEMQPAIYQARAAIQKATKEQV